MRRTLALPALAAAALAAGCGGEASVERLAAPIASGVNVDYTPLASPRDAVTNADLIVEGTLTDVTEGIGLTFPDRRYTERKAGSYATFVVTVDRIVSGDAAKLRDKRVYLAVRKSRAAEIGELAGANPQPRIVAVLDDITDWTPAAGVRVTRPAACPPTRRCTRRTRTGSGSRPPATPRCTACTPIRKRSPPAGATRRR